MRNAPSDPQRLLEEIDARQDEVLEKLAELNERVESLLRECLAAFRSTSPDAGPSLPPGGVGAPHASIPPVKMPRLADRADQPQAK
mgnify:CR=1 FL=1